MGLARDDRGIPATYPLTGPTTPTPRFVGDLWWDTTNNLLKQHPGTYTASVPDWNQVPGTTPVYKLLGVGASTGNQGITSTSSPGTAITGLSVTGTPDGTHQVKITVSLPDLNSSAGSLVNLSFQIAMDGNLIANSGAFFNAIVGGNTAASWVYTQAAPPNAAHTWTVNAWSGAANTISTNPNAFVTNSIVVEQVG